MWGAGREEDRGKERNSELPSAGLFPRYPQKLELDHNEARNQKLNPGLSCGWWGPAHVSQHLLLPSVHIYRKLELGQTQTQALQFGTQTSQVVS